MKTEIQSTQVRFRKECRKEHGTLTALEKAFDIIREKYAFNLKAEINKDSTFIIRLLIERKDYY